MIFLKTIIGIYALLMIIASTQSLIKEHDTNKKFHYINCKTQGKGEILSTLRRRNRLPRAEIRIAPTSEMSLKDRR